MARVSAEPVLGRPRYASVDALRGLAVAAMLLVNTPGDWAHVLAPLRHADWHGFTPTDLVFPLFLFIVGVSIALAGVSRPEAGVTASARLRPLLLRAARIVLLGLLLHALAWWLLDRAAFRPFGVLQRIGICFAVTAWLAVTTSARQQWFCFGASLVGYGLLLAAGGTLAPLDNLASRNDTVLLGPHLYEFDAVSGRGHDPEGLASTLPAIATCLLGLRCGHALLEGRLAWLVVAGGIAMGLGAGWALWQPINKNLWTASYVLWTGGLSMWLLSAAHGLVDRHGWPAWGRRFGVNAIAAYVGSAVMVIVLTATGAMAWIYQAAFSSWITPLFGPELASLAFALAFVAVWWVIVFLMDRRGWHLRV